MNLARSLFLVGPRGKKTDRGQRPIFPSETSQFAPCISVSRRGFSRPTPPRPSSVPGANLVLTHRLLSPFPLSMAARQFWRHGRWYERSGLWTQLAPHAWTPDHFLTSTVWVHPGREAARAGRTALHYLVTNARCLE